MLRRLFLASGLVLCAHAGEAASLSVSPIGIERVAPASAAVLTLSDAGTAPLNVQVRVFRWTQGAAGDVLSPTRDVVVSPPIVRLVPGTDYTVRVVRLAKAPPVGEEAYRILVDELPGPPSTQTDSVRMLLRYSIPAFFASPSATAAAVTWSVTHHDGSLLLRAVNHGSTHLRVAQVALASPHGKPVSLVAGLAGYVLGDSSMSWPLSAPVNAPRAGPGTLSFTSDGGLMDVPVVIAPGD